MTKIPEFGAVLQDAMGGYPVDIKILENAFKTQALLSEQLSGLAFTAAEKSTDISNKWTKETLAKLSEIATVKSDPADYSKAMTNFAKAQAEASSEFMAAYAEVAKTLQMKTVELFLSAGKDMTDEVTAAAKKTQSDMMALAKRTTR